MLFESKQSEDKEAHMHVLKKEVVVVCQRVCKAATAKQKRKVSKYSL